MCSSEVEPGSRCDMAWSEYVWLIGADKFAKGCYAVSVTGELPQDVIDSLQDKGIPYRSRDNSNR